MVSSSPKYGEIMNDRYEETNPFSPQRIHSLKPKGSKLPEFYIHCKVPNPFFWWDFQGLPIMGPPYDKLPIPLPKESLKIWNHPWFSAADILVSGWNKKTRGQLVGCFFYDRRLFFEGKFLQEIPKLASIEQKKKGPFDFLSERAHNGKAAANGSESMPSRRHRKKKRGGWEMWRFRTGLAGAKDQTGFLRK